MRSTVQKFYSYYCFPSSVPEVGALIFQPGDSQTLHSALKLQNLSRVKNKVCYTSLLAKRQHVST